MRKRVQEDISTSVQGGGRQFAIDPTNDVCLLESLRKSLIIRSQLPAGNSRLAQLNEYAFAAQFGRRTPVELSATERLPLERFRLLVVKRDVKYTIDPREAVEGPDFLEASYDDHTF